MQERRTQKRLPISYYMTIMDSNTGRIIGQLVDVTPTGMRMDSHLPIPAGEEFSITLELPGGIDGQMFLTLNTKAVWCRPDTMEPNFYNIGLQIMRPTPRQMEVIKVIATKFGKH